jgi:glycine cleavage system H protein
MEIPSDRRYHEEHEWALVEADGSVRVGISEFAEHELGDVIYVELPKVGDRVTQGKQMGEIESVKAVSDLYSPVSGEVVEVNTGVKDKPELVNDEPYGGGWLILVKIDSEAELANLLDATAYEALTH